MKTRGGTVTKPGAPIKKGKVTRVSKRLKAIKNVEINQRLKSRMNELSKRFEYTAKETVKTPKQEPQVVESKPVEEEEEEELEEEEKIVPEKIISLKEFDILRKRAVKILEKDKKIRTLMKTSLPTSENVSGFEGNGWRSVEEAEEGLMDVATIANDLAMEGWKVADFSGLQSDDQPSSSSSEDTMTDSASASSSCANEAAPSISPAFPLAHVWISPLGQWFGRWSDVESERKRLKESDKKIAQVLALSNHQEVAEGKGDNIHAMTIGAAGTKEYEEFLEGAKLRFLRDGVWIAREPWPVFLSQDLMASISKLTMKFFEQVLHTVSIRGLEDKLDVGFLSFRERGKGRFDLNPPELMSSEYDSLRDLNEPNWMPLVHKILGDNGNNSPMRLIHMGVFMSLPDSDTQVYHTDGVHLSEVCHLSPHAVNVFIPLIPLTRNAGPTEFSLGSHIFGSDAWDKTKLEIPCVPAGTPIIFDYRVGHRGLGNKLNIPRPVLYFTYSNKPGFKDHTNFSRKRYLPLPDLLELPNRKSSSRS